MLEVLAGLISEKYDLNPIVYHFCKQIRAGPDIHKQVLSTVSVLMVQRTRVQQVLHGSHYKATQCLTT